MLNSGPADQLQNGNSHDAPVQEDTSSAGEPGDDQSGHLGALDALPKANIDAVNKDLRTLEMVRQRTISEGEKDVWPRIETGADWDGLDQYLDDDPDDSLKVLENDFTINRKAVFHDIDRLRRWRESVDQEMKADHPKFEPSVEPLKEVENVTISEDNVCAILSKLPDVCSTGAGHESAASAKLAFLEKTLGLGTYILPEVNQEEAYLRPHSSSKI